MVQPCQNPVKFVPWVIALNAWLNFQWAWTSSMWTAEGSVASLWQTARDKGMKHGTSNGSACAVTLSPSGHKYSYQSLLSTTVLYQDLCQPAALLSSLSLSHMHTHTHTCTPALTDTTLLQKTLNFRSFFPPLKASSFKDWTIFPLDLFASQIIQLQTLRVITW